MELMKLAGIPAGAQAFTSLMHACIKEGSPENIKYAFQVPSLLTGSIEDSN